jgi:hypothetical protein
MKTIERQQLAVLGQAFCGELENAGRVFKAGVTGAEYTPEAIYHKLAAWRQAMLDYWKNRPSTT